jgi:16S rRNA (adenine1518-N6/adenine1519-N6)-dimethyltransferase
VTLPLRAKHALGQHFLRDESLLERMLDETPLKAGDSVFEIGPGLGDMTRVMARRAGRVLALEIDKDLVPVLRTQFMLDKHVDVVEGDIMTADLPQLLAPLGDFHVIANLPYYLTTPILTLLLQLPLPIKSICVTVQTEAARRVLAQPSSKEYGPLSLLAQYRTQPRAAMSLPRRLFTPPPHVDSTFLVMPALQQPPVQVQDEAAFWRLMQASFAMRRKTLVNNLMSGYAFDRAQAQAWVQAASLPLTVRAEALTLEQFAALDAARPNR